MGLQMGHQTPTKRDTTNSIYSYNNEERGNKDALQLLELFLGKETTFKPTNNELKILNSALKHKDLESWKPFMESYHKYLNDGGRAKSMKFFFQEDFRQFENKQKKSKLVTLHCPNCRCKVEVQRGIQAISKICEKCDRQMINKYELPHL